MVTFFYPLVHYSLICHPFFRNLDINIFGITTLFGHLVAHLPNSKLQKDEIRVVLRYGSIRVCACVAQTSNVQSSAWSTSNNRIRVGDAGILRLCYGLCCHSSRAVDAWKVWPWWAQPSALPCPGHCWSLYSLFRRLSVPKVEREMEGCIRLIHTGHKSFGWVLLCAYKASAFQVVSCKPMLTSTAKTYQFKFASEVCAPKSYIKGYSDFGSK